MTKETFWLVWNEEKKTFPPKHKHDTSGGAEAEAERLARANPGETFVVLKSVSYRAIDSMVRGKYEECPF
jgi:hypothetical protein